MKVKGPIQFSRLAWEQRQSERFASIPLGSFTLELRAVDGEIHLAGSKMDYCELNSLSKVLQQTLNGNAPYDEYVLLRQIKSE